MRKSREEAALTRQRIVASAASEFRKNGIVATGLAELMKSAGLTHGGFYKHFESKEQLVAEANAEAIQTLVDQLTAVGADPVATYLSTRHRDNPSSGCPLSAIGSELGRSDEQTRGVATDGILQLVEILARKYDQLPPSLARKRALVAVSTMIGAITLSRIVTDAKLSTEILREAEKSLTEK